MRINRFFIAGLGAAIAFATVLRAADVNNYRVTILVSNEPGEAPVIDSKLVNGWGIATAGASPWWVSDNGSDWSTVYNGAGAKQSREVVVSGAPTGIVGYTGSQFLVFGRPSTFMCLITAHSAFKRSATPSSSPTRSKEKKTMWLARAMGSSANSM